MIRRLWGCWSVSLLYWVFINSRSDFQHLDGFWVRPYPEVVSGPETLSCLSVSHSDETSGGLERLYRQHLRPRCTPEVDQGDARDAQVPLQEKNQLEINQFWSTASCLLNFFKIKIVKSFTLRIREKGVNNLRNINERKTWTLCVLERNDCSKVRKKKQQNKSSPESLQVAPWACL